MGVDPWEIFVKRGIRVTGESARDGAEALHGGDIVLLF